MQKTTQDTINNVVWKACDTFRGTMDGSDYKDYVLTMLFVKYLSDFYKEKLEQLKAEYGNKRERIEAKLKKEKFKLDESCAFEYLLAHKEAANLGEIMKKSASGEYGEFLRYLPLGKIANLIFIVIIAANCAQAFIVSGPPPYLGSSTPARLSLDPAKWFWEKDHWQSALDFRFDWNPELPDLPN